MCARAYLGSGQVSDSAQHRFKAYANTATATRANGHATPRHANNTYSGCVFIYSTAIMKLKQGTILSYLDFDSVYCLFSVRNAHILAIYFRLLDCHSNNTLNGRLLYIHVYIKSFKLVHNPSPSKLQQVAACLLQLTLKQAPT